MLCALLHQAGHQGLDTVLLSGRERAVTEANAALEQVQKALRLLAAC